MDIRSDKLDYLKKSRANFFPKLHQIKAFIMGNKMTLISSKVKIELSKFKYPKRTIITSGLYTYYPFFEDHFIVFKDAFSVKFSPYVWLVVFKSGLYLRAVCNQERVIIARVRYMYSSPILNAGN